MFRCRRSGSRCASRSADVVDREVVPHAAGWDGAARVDPGIGPAPDKLGFLGSTLDESSGGSGGTTERQQLGRPPTRPGGDGDPAGTYRRDTRVTTLDKAISQIGKLLIVRGRTGVNAFT
jgi:hypothetical protein